VADARKALEESHDTVVDGRHIRVEQARVNRTLFLTKLPKTLNQEILLKYLEKWGKVEDVTILSSPSTGRSKGCGFAKFRYREDAIRAYLVRRSTVNLARNVPSVQFLIPWFHPPQHIRQQGKWSVEWAANIEKQQPEADRHSIFVGQLNANKVTEEILENHFLKYGSIESVHLVNKNGEGTYEMESMVKFC
jgi:RNA recognition motif-containing protein